MSEHDAEQDCLRIAEATRAACLAAALESYEEAGIRGLCHEGAWECAIGAIQSLNLRRILARLQGEQQRDREGEGKVKS